ncbi:hypothetical protein ILUMI_21000 [Ignelater luminosus]|uniref:GAG-pre-integrase domain-containing protein n=1 Tax=Ignelater luminosus TaxID=2038154 RepID=A0A8K0CDB2_IGNLU|nr:hypothetical protein ILUMI_21000 [Ignelater luminosus]
MKVDTRENCEENNLLAGYVSGIRSIQDWHERLAHQNFQHVRSLLKSLNIEFKDDKNAFCEYCLQGKQCRQPFRISTTEVNELCNTISADLCGPMEVPSVGGSKYFLLLKDHYNQVHYTARCLNNTVRREAESSEHHGLQCLGVIKPERVSYTKKPSTD